MTEQPVSVWCRECGVRRLIALDDFLADEHLYQSEPCEECGYIGAWLTNYQELKRRKNDERMAAGHDGD